MEDYRYNQYDEYGYGDEPTSDYSYEMADPSGGGGGGGSGPSGETRPGGYSSPPTQGPQESIPSNPPEPTYTEISGGGGTTSTESTVTTDGTTPGDNEGYEGEIRTVMTESGPTMYIKQGGVWVVYYGTSNFNPDGSNITEVIQAALETLGVVTVESSGSTTVEIPTTESASITDATITNLTVTNLTATNQANFDDSTESGIDHGSSLTGLGDDDHTIYALLAGRSGGQTFKGGTDSGDHLLLESTNDGTKGVVKLNPNGGSASIGTTAAPLGGLHIQNQVGTNVSLHMANSSDTDMYGQIHTTAAGAMILRAHSDTAAPIIEFQTQQSSSTAAGDIVFANTAGDVRPNDDTPTVNLGTSTKKFKDIWAETLRVQTLINEEVIATIGGRIIVSPSTSLADNLANNDTTAKFRHSMTNGTYAVLKKAGTTEYIKIVGSIGSGTGADGKTYYTHPITKPDGSARNGSGTYAWDAGDCVAGWCGSAIGDGMMELYADASLRDASGNAAHADGPGLGAKPAGPSILGRVRTDAGNYYDTAEAWCVGNLDNTFGNSGTLYGLAAGRYQDNGSWIQVDGTTGFSIKHNKSSPVTKFSVSYTGDTKIGNSASSSGSYVFIAGSDGHDMIGTNLVNTGDVLLYGGSADKYIHLDTSASTISIKGSGTSSIVLDGSSSGTITTTGIIQGSAFQTGTANQRVIVSDNDITNTGDGGSSDGAASNLTANTMAAFVEILPHGSSTDNTGGNNDDYVMLGITKNISNGSKLKLGGHHTTNGKVNGFHQTIAKQNVASASIGDSVLSQWWAMDNDAGGRKYESSHAFQIKANTLSQYIYKTSDTTWYNSNLMDTATPAGTTVSQFEAAMNASKIRSGGYLQVGANISGGSGCVSVCPSPYDSDTLHTTFMNAVSSGFGTKWDTDIEDTMKHNKQQWVNHIVSNRALAISSRGTKLVGTTASTDGYNFFGHASGAQSDSSGRISIRRIHANTTGWAVGVISKQMEHNLAILMWVYISDSTVSWAFLDQAGNTSTTDGEGFSSQTNTITIVDNENEDNRININLSQNEVKTYYWHQLCGSVAMGAAAYEAG